MDAPSLLERAVRCLSAYGIKADVAFGSPQEENSIIARRAVKDGYKTVIAMGGDGTIGAVIRGIAGSDITLGIIAAGTMNDIAASLSIPEDVEEACALIAKGKTRKLDLGVIKTNKNKKFYFFMVTAIGLTAALFPDMEKVVKGHLSKLKDAITTLTHYKTKPEIVLTLDKDSKIAEENLIPDGKLQRFRASTVKIKSKTKLEIAADGISLGKGTAVIKMRHGALRVYAPAVGSGDEKSKVEKLAELDAPLSPFVENNDTKENKKQQKKKQHKKQQDHRTTKRSEE